MYGYPKIIQTRHDIEYLVGYLGTSWATDENRQRGIDHLKSLRDNTKHYVFDRDLNADEQPDGPGPGYFVVEDEDGRRRQLRLEEDPNAPIHRLGLTTDEVDTLISTIKETR
jgi:hypothetical protein